MIVRGRFLQDELDVRAWQSCDEAEQGILSADARYQAWFRKSKLPLT
jgi:hypothetical protein